VKNREAKITEIFTYCQIMLPLQPQKPENHFQYGWNRKSCQYLRLQSYL
jgi:hypothetical protein